MSVSRANLRGGPAKATWNAINMFTREEIRPVFKRNGVAVPMQLFGVVDETVTDRMIEVPLQLWGAVENLGVLFPSALLAPTYVGGRIYGTTDLPLVIHASNQDRLTIHNAQITQLANLFLGVSAPVFAADVMFTGLIKNNANPEDADAYFTMDTAAFAGDTGFSKTNFRQVRYQGAWGTVAGFTSFQAKEGVNVRWKMNLEPETVDGVGTVDFVNQGIEVDAAAIPIEPTNAQIITASHFQGQALGHLRGSVGATGVGDLVFTGSGLAVTLKNAVMLDPSFAFGMRPLRNGEIAWRSTVGVTTGAAAARAVVA